jgi:hypothetical protein
VAEYELLQRIAGTGPVVRAEHCRGERGEKRTRTCNSGDEIALFVESQLVYGGRVHKYVPANLTSGITERVKISFHFFQ